MRERMLGTPLSRERLSLARDRERHLYSRARETCGGLPLPPTGDSFSTVHSTLSYFLVRIIFLFVLFASLLVRQKHTVYGMRCFCLKCRIYGIRPNRLHDNRIFGIR